MDSIIRSAVDIQKRHNKVTNLTQGLRLITFLTVEKIVAKWISRQHIWKTTTKQPVAEWLPLIL